MFSRRVRISLLAVGIGLVTVGVPPLLLPRASPPPPPAVADPSPSLSPSLSASPSPSPSLGGCGAGGSTRPACLVYGSALGTGWNVQSTGVKVVPAGIVPGTEEVALRVEPKEKTASVSLVAATPVAAKRLTFRVFGGRVHGTVLRVTVSTSAAPSGRPPVVLTAPVDEWTPFSLDLAELGAGSGLRRIDLVIATDMVPNAYRFFVDDVQLR